MEYFFQKHPTQGTAHPQLPPNSQANPLTDTATSGILLVKGTAVTYRENSQNPFEFKLKKSVYKWLIINEIR